MATSQPTATVAHRLWATLANDADHLVDPLGDGLSPRVPFEQGGHLKNEVAGAGRTRRDAAVARVVNARPQLEQVDPRGLHATQGGLGREGVRYYLGTGYTRWGLTYADRDSLPVPGAHHVTALLTVGSATPAWPCTHHEQPSVAAEAMLRGQAVQVSDPDTVARILHDLGAQGDQAHARVQYALTGQFS